MVARSSAKSVLLFSSLILAFNFLMACKSVDRSELAAIPEGPNSSYENSFQPSDSKSYWADLTAAAQRVSKMQQFVVQAVNTSLIRDKNKGYAWGDNETGYPSQSSWGPIDPHRKIQEYLGSAEDGRSHCSGTSLMIVRDALSLYYDWSANKKFDPFNGIDRAGYQVLENCWWMQESMAAKCDMHGAQAALMMAGIGEPVTFDQLQPGDFGQIWRRKSGHTVVFLQYIYDDMTFSTKFDKTRVVGFQYYSSSSYTNGVGILHAYVSDPAVFAHPEQDTRCASAKKNDRSYDCPVFLDTTVNIGDRSHRTSFARLLEPKRYVKSTLL